MTESPLRTDNNYKLYRSPDGTRLYEVEVLHPGVARLWDETSTGLKVLTNISPDRINNRTDKPILFNSEAAVWLWARRIQIRG